MSEKTSDKSENEWPTGMVTNFHVYYVVWCAVCDLVFDDTTPEVIRRRDEEEWANAVQREALRQGWKDFRDHEALCPTCAKGDYLAEHELNLAKHELDLAQPQRKRASDAKKAKEAVDAVTRKTWMQKIRRHLQKLK